MTVLDLEKILELMDWGEICAELERRGFRRTDTEGVPEFEWGDIVEDGFDCQDVESEIDPEGIQYMASICWCEARYAGKTFIQLFKRRYLSSTLSLPMLLDFEIFTNAPINEEFLKEVNSLCRCQQCKKRYVKKTLIKVSGKLICARCQGRNIKKAQRMYNFCRMRLWRMRNKNANDG